MMDLTLKVIPANVFNELMGSSEISMNDLVEQLVMNEFHTKNSLTESSVQELKQLIEYIEKD